MQKLEEQVTKIILLNGVGSAGKTSIARALQEELPDIYLHVQMDMFLDMLPEKRSNHPDTFEFAESLVDGHPITSIHTGPVGHRLLKGMRASIEAMASLGSNLIVDEVLLGDNIDTYRDLFSPFQLYTVGVLAPLDVLEKREKDRKDRILGLARWQYDLVHKGITYDVEVDTSTASSEICARQIVASLDLLQLADDQLFLASAMGRERRFVGPNPNVSNLTTGQKPIFASYDDEKPLWTSSKSLGPVKRMNKLNRVVAYSDYALKQLVVLGCVPLVVKLYLVGFKYPGILGRV